MALDLEDNKNPYFPALGLNATLEEIQNYINSNSGGLPITNELNDFIIDASSQGAGNESMFMGTPIDFSQGMPVSGKFNSLGVSLRNGQPTANLSVYDIDNSSGVDVTAAGSYASMSVTDLSNFSSNSITVTINEIKMTLPTYADNTAAQNGGLSAGALYATSTGEVRIVVNS